MSDTSSLQILSASIADLVETASASVVGIHSHRSLSSGFAWRPDLVVTASEGLAEEGDIEITLPGGETRAGTLAGRDPSTDIALLRIDGADLTPVALDPARVRTGALVIAVGSSGGAPLASFGATASAGPEWRSMRGGRIDARIELDIRLRRRAEGGVALDAYGQAIGMAVFGPRRRVLVIPAATIVRIAPTLETKGRVARGYLGLSLQPVRLPGEGIGAMVMGVEAGGPGDRAGVKQGDVITTWNGEAVESVHALIRALGPESVGEAARLGIQRGGEPLDIELTIGEKTAR